MSTAVSKIPVATGSAHRRNSNGSRNGSPERKKSSPSKIPTPTNNGSSSPLKMDRPQSIDIEDEFKNTLQYARLVSSLKHNHDSRIPIKSRESSPVKNGCEQQQDFCNSSSSGDCGSPSPTKSKIPVLQGGGGQTTSSSMSSRKLSQPATCKKPDSTDPKQKFEAFMMTGDRIIHLAKTPAAIKNKQPKVERNDLPMLPPPIDILDQDEDDAGKHHQRTVPPSSQNKEQNKNRSSESGNEDLVSIDTLLEDESNQRLQLLHHSAGNGGGVGELEGSKASPDFSTSSLISSEHYNGESLLDNLSNSSSPDTPEWSLVDSFHKQQQRRRSSIDKAPLLTIEDEKEESEEEVEQVTAETNEEVRSSSSSSTDEAHEAIKSEGNRVIITITGSEGSRSSNATDSELSILSAAAANTASTVINAGQDSGSEESDLESLRSYHPPMRTVDVPSAERLAKRLYYLDGFKRTDVSRHLGKNNDFSQVVAEEYLRHFELGDCLSLDQALRRFLQQFCLTGETQERERVLLHFSKRYLECNPSLMAPTHFRSLDAVHTLTCAIMLLNTDLHGDNLQRKMTCNEFIENLRELNDGQNFPRDLLRSTYYSIKDASIPWATDEPEEQPLQAANSPTTQVAAASSQAATVSHSANDPIKTVISAFSDIAGGGGSDNHVNPFLELPNAATAVDFKKGYVMRKCCVDPNGKKTKLGKRSWRMFFLTLRDMVLYCFKDEKSPVFDDFSAAIRIHHGLAVRASDYTKKKHVFRLYTADRAEYLFQTSDEKELLTWIDAINYVLASFSAPQLPAACSSSSKFQRPLMPSSKSTLEMSDQLASHEVQLQQLRRQYEEELRTSSTSSSRQQNNPQPMSKSKSSWSEYKEKEEFLLFEIMRYETYILTLRTKNAHDT